MINLLPPQALRRARREYRLRLAALMLFSLALVFLASAAFLTPSYLFARIERANALERHELFVGGKKSENAAAQSAQVAEVNALLSAARLPAPSVTEMLRELLSLRPSRVSLVRIAFDGGAPAHFSLSGVAATRDALLAFKRALEESRRFSSVELPISNLAKSSDIEFSLTVTIQTPQ